VSRGDERRGYGEREGSDRRPSSGSERPRYDGDRRERGGSSGRPEQSRRAAGDRGAAGRPGRSDRPAGYRGGERPTGDRPAARPHEERSWNPRGTDEPRPDRQRGGAERSRDSGTPYRDRADRGGARPGGRTDDRNRDASGRGPTAGGRPDQRGTGDRDRRGGYQGGRERADQARSDAGRSDRDRDARSPRDRGERRPDSRSAAGRGDRRSSGPDRRSSERGDRAERRAPEGVTTTRVPEPDLPEGITPGELDAEARRDLRGLQKDTAEVVAKHLVAAGRLVDEDPERALEHARFARRRASRIAVVREAAGIAAYHAGEWNEALGELRAARRMGGGPGHLAVMADIERAMGRPERALELVRSPEAKELGRAETIELAIVAAGARRDLGELDAAVVGLQIPELEPSRREPWSARLFYAYADNLLAAGRESDALQWFVHTADADEQGETDAAERIADLTGEPIDEDDVVFQGEIEIEVAEIEADPDAPEADVAAEGGTDAVEDDVFVPLLPPAEPPASVVPVEEEPGR
jgi:hypothetical protein